MWCLPEERGASHRGAAAQLDHRLGALAAPAHGVSRRVADRDLVVCGGSLKSGSSESAVAARGQNEKLFQSHCRVTRPTDVLHLLGVDSAQDLRLPRGQGPTHGGPAGTAVGPAVYLLTQVDEVPEEE